jgi:hypothetical protein
MSVTVFAFLQFDSTVHLFFISILDVDFLFGRKERDRT